MKYKSLEQLAQEGNRLAKFILESDKCDHNWVYQKTEKNKDIYFCSKCFIKKSQ